MADIKKSALPVLTPQLTDFTDFVQGGSNGRYTNSALLGLIQTNFSAAVVKSKYESNADTNAFTDAEKTKLAGIETGATADQTAAEIESLYESNANTNKFTDAQVAKLAGIAAGAEVNTVDSVNGLTGAVVLATTNISEGTNLYYTQGRFDSAFAAKDTGDLAEGANLYYTQGRFDTAFAAKDTDDLAEGVTNLFFTDARADARIAAQKGLANGLATLGPTGKIPSAQIPAFAISETFVVASEAAQLASGAEIGDFVVRTDENKTYIHNGGVAGDMTDYNQVLTTSDVVSVNGQTGAVVLDTDDVAEGATNLYYTEARVSANPAVAANTAKISADGSIDTHSDVDTSGASEGDILVLVGGVWTPQANSSPSAGSIIEPDFVGNILFQQTTAALTFISGSGLSIVTVGSFALCGLNETDIAYIDSQNDLLTRYRFNGATWSQIGNALSVDINNAALTALDENTVALADSNLDRITTYSWDGTDWSAVGTPFSYNFTNASLATLDSTTIAVVSDATNELLTLSWNGSVWSQVGNALSLTNNNLPSIDALNSTTIAYCSDGSNQLKTYSWDGSDWSQVGTPFATGGLLYNGIGAVNSDTVVIQSSVTDQIRAYKWNGATWSLLTSISVPPHTTFNGICTFGTSGYIARIDRDNDELRTYQLVPQLDQLVDDDATGTLSSLFSIGDVVRISGTTSNNGLKTILGFQNADTINFISVVPEAVTAGNIVVDAVGENDVNSVNGQTGAVVLEAADISADPSGSNLTETTVQGQIDEIVASPRTWTEPQRGAISDIAYAASVTLDFSTSNNFRVAALTGNITLENPTNQVAGQSGMIFLRQDATGGRTITWGTNWLFPNNGVEPALSTEANALDVLYYFVESNGAIVCNLVKRFA